MLFQDAPPDTSAYMVAGYIVFALILGIYLFSLYVRKRNLDRDLAALNGLRQERTAAESKPASAKRKRAGIRTPRSKPVRNKPARRK